MNNSVDYYSQAHRHLRRLLSVLFAFVVVQMQMWSADTYQGVTLTKPAWNKATSRYLIKNRAELLWWAVNDQNKDIQLEADINVQDEGKHLLAADGRTLAMNENEIVVWPCLYYRASRINIEGNNHTISGIYQNRGYGVDGVRGSSKKYDRVGFISYSATKAVITNLNIADTYICGKYAGGFIGYKMPDGVNVRTTELKNNSFRGYVKADWYGGGFVGWHRTDGEDLNVYRCFNYGTIEAGGPDITDYEPSDNRDNTVATMAAGGIIGYLDIKHTPVLQISTNFNRCVNYGSISCMTDRGNAGGIVGHVWDNNNGKRQWDFCYDFGKITNAESGQGASIVGCYRLNNGCVTPKFRWCGASKTDGSGGTVVNYVWKEYGDCTSNYVLFVGNKTCYTKGRLTALQENLRSITDWFIFDNPEARARNFLNNYKLVTLANVVSGTSYIGDEDRVNRIAAKYYEKKNNAAFDFYYPNDILMFRFNPIDKVPVLSSSAALTSIPTTGYGELYNSIRSESNAADVMQAHSLIYTEEDLRNGRFAYDANLSMQADVLDGKRNTDKSPLFVQHLDIDDSAQSDTLPAIAYEGKNDADKLYWGHYHCFQEANVSNDANAGTEPREHKYDENGVCQYCHASMQPLDAVYGYTSLGQQYVKYYMIKNQSQLRYFAAVINDNYDGMRYMYRNKEVKLVNDIEFSPNVTWIPINIPFVDPSQKKWLGFCGTFDGQGHTISGLRTAENSTYAGLFAYANSRVPMQVKNLKLSNCVFKGRYAGSIIGQVDGKENAPVNSTSYDSPANRPVLFDHVAVDNTVEVVPTNTESDAAAGGFVGYLSRVDDSNYDIAFSNCYSNVRITCLQQQANRVGNFVGYCSNLLSGKKEHTSTKPLFDHCYFGGTATCELNPMGTVEGTDKVGYKLFNESYNVGGNANTVADGTLPVDITRSYLESGRMAYDLMQQSKYDDANGQTHYNFAQEGRNAVLTDTIAPTLCKLQVATKQTEVALGDTIINLMAENPLQLPFSYAGHNFKDAMLVGWENANHEGTPTYSSGESHDYSGLRTKPHLYYTLYVDADNTPEVLNVSKEEEWKGAGVIAGNRQTNVLATQLVLGGINAWSLPQAPEVIDGHNNTIVAQQPLVSEKTETAANGAVRAANTRPDVTIKNVRVRTDVLTENVLSYGNRHLNIENAILQPLYDTDLRTWFDLNTTANHKENTEGVNLQNVVGQETDSTSIIFYQNGTSLQRITFSDANKNNDYAHILGHMLAQDDLFNTFGLRLDTINAKVAGKLGFATDEGKRIYRAKVYNQATGVEVGEVLMNSDAVATFSVESNRLGAMHKGLPKGTFAVLQQTRNELGADFQRLAANVITKDGHATCLRIDERVTEGFAYPEGLASDIRIVANNVEYIRQVRRDGAFESIYLPFSFTTLEFDEQEFTDPADQIEICFMQPKEDDVINSEGNVDFMSVGAYKQKKFDESLDFDTDLEVADEVAVACVPYLIRFDGRDRKDELTTVTFSCNEACVVYRDAEQYNDAFLGVFSNSSVSQVANGKKIYRLESAVNEQTGESYSRFVRANENDVIDAFHCYMSTNSLLAGDVINIAVDGSLATGVNNVKSNAVKGNDSLYDISGRRVVKMRPHNVYIKNGKKIVCF